MTEVFMRSAWFHDHPPKHSSISQTARTYEFVHWLLQTYSPSSINVLLLHVELQHGKDENSTLALLLLEYGPGVWTRLGLCQWWKLRNRAVAEGFFEGCSDEWDVREGIFGFID